MSERREIRVNASLLPDGEPLLDFPTIAERLDVPVTHVVNLVKSHQLLAVKDEGVRKVPAVFFGEKGVNRFIPGLITVLSDGGYNDEEILRYLFTEDDSLPGRPVDALHGHLAREVMRRAQGMAV
ncbi:DNA-binding protein [Corynebacterium uropygiale]|uniref:DNA-binding protein n=1 Tax=Corynebacterium uropygiale TaxID=1775911 RepID=A0A9X1QSM0_9CORY|nr:Rv2175c family DNA-binding protein [Corynebacterium uropygiale]MCF4006270.1 DNA-binding protein [Corynebacterium uropygiale]